MVREFNPDMNESNKRSQSKTYYWFISHKITMTVFTKKKITMTEVKASHERRPDLIMRNSVISSWICLLYTSTHCLPRWKLYRYVCPVNLTVDIFVHQEKVYASFCGIWLVPYGVVFIYFVSNLTLKITAWWHQWRYNRNSLKFWK